MDMGMSQRLRIKKGRVNTISILVGKCNFKRAKVSFKMF